MKNILLILTIVQCATHLVESQDCSMHKVYIVCSNISIGEFPYVEDVLVCIGDKKMNLTIPGSYVSSVVHSNGSKVTNHSDIEGLNIFDSTVHFIPNGIKSQFPKLKLLDIERSGLLSVKMENLRDFGDMLVFLDLHGNKLTSIDANLLDHNPNLQAIYLNGNPIRHIEPAFFTNLKSFKSIKQFNFESTGCINQDFDSPLYHHKIETYIWNYEKCTDETAKIETQHLINEALCDEAKSLMPTTQTPDDKFNSTLASRLDSVQTATMKMDGKGDF